MRNLSVVITTAIMATSLIVEAYAPTIRMMSLPSVNLRSTSAVKNIRGIMSSRSRPVQYIPLQRPESKISSSTIVFRWSWPLKFLQHTLEENSNRTGLFSRGLLRSILNYVAIAGIIYPNIGVLHSHAFIIRDLAMLVISYGMCINIVEVSWKARLKVSIESLKVISLFIIYCVF